MIINTLERLGTTSELIAFTEEQTKKIADIFLYKKILSIQEHLLSSKYFFSKLAPSCKVQLFMNNKKPAAEAAIQRCS